MARIKIDGFRCERCGHKWVKRGDEDPKVCPKCKSPYWDTPKGDKSSKNKKTSIIVGPTSNKQGDLPPQLPTDYVPKSLGKPPKM